MRRVTISPQRVAVEGAAMADLPPPQGAGRARAGLILGGLGAGLAAGLVLLVLGRAPGRRDQILRRLGLHPDQRALARAARRSDAAGAWRAARRLMRHHAVGEAGQAAMRQLETHLFGPDPTAPDLRRFRQVFTGALAD